MTRNKRKQPLSSTPKAQPASVSAVAASSAPGKKSILRRLPVTPIVVFLLFWIFCSLVYGDVFRRTAEANFITADDTQMAFLLRQPLGRLYIIGRWMLLPMSNTLLGGALLSLVLTLTAVCTDSLLGLKKRWKGIGAVVPVAVIVWILLQGTNLYHKSEPSRLVLVPVITLLIVAVLAAVKALVMRRKHAADTSTAANAAPRRIISFGTLIAVAAIAGVSVFAKVRNADEILTARVQNLAQEANWDGIIDAVSESKRPPRTAAAYYAIALLQTNQLLDRIFEIPYDFPKVRLQKRDGNEEYAIFQADADLYAGLVNPAYRCSMDYIVMYGMNLYDLKRAAICAILNKETALADKYLDIIESMPFNGDFVEKYRPMATSYELVEQDPVLANILALHPQEKKAFEQNYRQPVFLGYNMGLLQGSDQSLETAIAAILYSKDLAAGIPHMRIYAQKKGGILPVCVQQALTILAQKDPQIAQEFASIVQSQQATLVSFVTAAKPLIDERMSLSQGKSQAEQDRIRQDFNVKMRETLGDDWTGTYFYYYYCENNNKDQVREKTKTEVN